MPVLRYTQIPKSIMQSYEGCEILFLIDAFLAKEFLTIQHAIQIREGFATGWDFSPHQDTQYKRYLDDFRSLMSKLDTRSFNIFSDILQAENSGDKQKMLTLIHSLSDNELQQYHNIRDAWVKTMDRRDFLFSKWSEQI